VVLTYVYSRTDTVDMAYKYTI